MKKLATILAAVGCLALVTPAFACPHSDKAETSAPKTAKKADKKEAPKADKTKTAKPAPKKTDKKAEKVSQK